MARAVWIGVAGVRLLLLRPEDLLLMKAVAHCPQDLADIEAILVANRGPT